MAFDHQQELPATETCGPSQFIGSRALTPLAEFFREYNDRYFTYTITSPMGRAAELPSMAYSIGGPLIPTILMEQVLIQHKALLDIIADDNIGSIGRYGAVVLPEQDSLRRTR
jgi:hypothetical protein